MDYLINLLLDNINMLYTSVAEGSLNESSEGGELGLFNDNEWTHYA